MFVGIIRAAEELRGECELKEVTLSSNKVVTVVCEGIAARARDKLICRCDECGVEFTPLRANHLPLRKDYGNEDLCKDCKRVFTSRAKYGVEDPNQSGVVKAKQQKTGKVYEDGEGYRRKTSSDAELLELKKANLAKARKVIHQDKEAWRNLVRVGSQEARKDPDKYRVTEEQRRLRIERLAKHREDNWKNPAYREKMSKLRYRVSKFQRHIFESLDTSWQLEYPIPGTQYTADMCNPRTKEVIECFGDFWHCHPDTYAPDYYHPLKKKTAQEIWDFDATRIERLEQLGYHVEIVWERDATNWESEALNG